MLTAIDTSLVTLLLRPALTRLFATRITARTVALPEETALLVAGTLEMPCGGSLGVAIDCAGGALLLERMFGAPGASGGEAAVADLPPGSASWRALAGFLAEAVAGVLVQAGTSVAPPQLAARPAAPDASAATLAFALDVQGAPAVLVLVASPAPPARPEAGPAAQPVADALWRRRTHSRAMGIELPVALRLFRTRLPLPRVIALRPGDILPLPRPSHLSLLVAGEVVAELPAHSLFAVQPADPAEPQ